MSRTGKRRAIKRRSIVLTSAISAISLLSTHLHADTTAEWIAGSGNWTTATDWSTNPNIPNNGTPGGTNYQVLIDQPSTGAYTVTVNGNETVDSISISNANATLSDSSRALTLGAMNISAGLFNLNGGTLSGGLTGALVTLNSPSQFSILNGTLDRISFSGSDLNLAAGAAVNIFDGLSLSGGSWNLQNGDTLWFQNAQTIDNLALKGIGSTQAQLFLPASNGVNLTLGSNALVHGNIILGGNASAQIQVINNGTISADLPTGTVSVNNTFFQNNAQMNAVNGSTLSFNSQSWTNSAGATISANNSTLNLSGSFTNLGSITTLGASTVNLNGTFTLANLGNYTASSSTIANINGTLDNTGQTLTFAGTGGKWLLWGTVLNGNLNAGTNMFTVTGTLNGVTNNAGNVIGVQFLDFLTMAGSWSNLGIIQATGAATINLGGTFSYSNIGTLNIAPTTDVNITGTLNNAGNNFTWSNGTWLMVGGTIQGGQLTVPNGQQLFVFNGNSTLNGVAIAPNSNITVDPNSRLQLFNGSTNNGRILVNQGELDVDPTVANNGTIALNGGTLHALNAAHTQTGTFNLGDGTLTGSGTVIGNLVMSSDPSQLSFNIGGSNQGSYDSLTVNGSVSLAGDLNLTLTNGAQNTLTAGETFDVLTVTGTNTLTGAFDDVASGGRLETTDGLGSFEVDYGTGPNANEIILSNFVATPEPGSLGLLIGSAFLMRRRPKKRMTR